MYETMSISTGLYPNLDLWNANKLHYSCPQPRLVRLVTICWRLSMIVFPLDCWPCFKWWWFPLEPLPVQPWVATVLHMVLIPFWPLPFQCWVIGSASCGACVLFDHSLFSVGLLAVLHVVLVPPLTTSFSALGFWQCFTWCLPPLWPVLFSLGLIAMLYLVWWGLM